ncbi:hypothetical protein Avbf_06680 [Armadillidium vulgare]|nr:hypothetical protein Avbf_06680 [Armadillidium vulgare]
MQVNLTQQSSDFESETLSLYFGFRFRRIFENGLRITNRNERVYLDAAVSDIRSFKYVTRNKLNETSKRNRRMEDLVSCNICAQVFDSLHFIPKMLIKCGHSFCSPCLTKLLQENPHCPNCRAESKRN